MQATGGQPQWAPDGASVNYERHRPDQTTFYRLWEQYCATFFAQADDAAGADLQPPPPSKTRLTRVDDRVRGAIGKERGR